ncbi:MAG: SIS domain-containing protein [Bacilli bacterium]|nr:SIS domain-containing protein [Bacilli bacterium]
MLFENYPELLPIKKDIDDAIDAIIDCYSNGGKLVIAGNGGSASDSSPLVGELMKSFILKRELPEEIEQSLSKYEDGEYLIKNLQGSLPAVDLTSSNAIISAFSNDVDPTMVYAQLVLGYGASSKNDVFIGLSTSGNSKNIVNAVKVAKAIGLKTICFTGGKDSKCSQYSDITIKAPSTETYRVQEYHLPIYHYICIKIEEHFYKNK